VVFVLYLTTKGRIMELYIRDFPDDLHAWAKKAAVDARMTLREYVMKVFKDAIEMEKQKGGEKFE
jgi:hypothetical protein